MADSGTPEYSEAALEEMNEWIDEVHAALQSSGAPTYESTHVRPLDRQFRKEIGNYLKEQFSMDYTSILFFLDGMECVYHAEKDVFLVSYDSIQDLPGEFELGVLAHEQGHRAGYTIIEDRLEPMHEEGEISDKALKMLQSYFVSENFAERTKVAVGNSLGRDFTYWEELADESPLIYRLRDRIGPEELVDTERDETLPEMMDSTEVLLQQAANGEADWLN